MPEPRTKESGTERVYVLVMRYHRQRDETKFTRCGRWLAASPMTTRDDAEAQDFTYCRKCFGQDGGRPE